MVNSYLNYSTKPQSHVHCQPVVHPWCGFMAYHYTTVLLVQGVKPHSDIKIQKQMSVLLLCVLHTLPNTLLVILTAVVRLVYKVQGTSVLTATVDILLRLLW